MQRLISRQVLAITSGHKLHGIYFSAHLCPRSHATWATLRPELVPNPACNGALIRVGSDTASRWEVPGNPDI